MGKALLDYKVVMGVGASYTILGASGVVPKFGLGRALSVALRSWIAFRPAREQRCVREEEMKQFYSLVETSKLAYAVVTGAKGVGKTVFINSALSGKFGVLDVGIAPGLKQDDILRKVYDVLAGRPMFGSSAGAAWRMFRLAKFFRMRFTVIFRLSERSDDNPGSKDYAEITGAARDLVNLGCRVVIDASPNALAPTALSTGRQVVVRVGLMTLEMVMRVPKWKAVFDQLETVGLKDVAWQIVGGLGVALDQLAELGNRTDNDKEYEKLVVQMLVDYVRESLATIDKSPADYQARVLPLFAVMDRIPAHTVKALGVALPSPDKVCHNNAEHVEPVNPAMAFVLKYQLHAAVAKLDELKKAIIGKTENVNTTALYKALCVVVTNRADKRGVDQQASAFHKLADNVSMADAMAMIAKAEGYELSLLDNDAETLKKNLIFTVKNLRALAPPRIEALNLSPVVTERLLHIREGSVHDPAAGASSSTTATTLQQQKQEK